MDYVNEDVSARILLKHVLNTEHSVSPETNSASQAALHSSGSKIRRSARLGCKVVVLTPQEAIKQSMKKKLRESTYRTSLQMPPTKRRTISEGVRKMNSPAPATTSILCDDDITPRHLLRGILQTEPSTSLLIQDRPVRMEPEQPYANSSLLSNSSSTGLSELDLPDMTTTVNLGSTAKGLRRKRPRRSLNVNAFNRLLESGEDGGGGGEGSSATEDLSLLSSASPSSVTFSLKTPFVDPQTEKRAFKRNAPNRKKITIEEFDEALQNQQVAMSGDTELSDREDQRGLSETVQSQGLMLGLSDIVDPDITFDIITNKTALYAQPVETKSTFTTKDKDTIAAAPIKPEMGGMKDDEVRGQKDDEMELDDKDGEALMTDAGQREDSVRQEDFKSQTEEVAESQTEEEGADPQTEEEVADLQTEEDVVDPQTEEEVADPQTEEVVADPQTEEEEVADPQTEEEEVADPHTEEEEVADPHTEEEEVADPHTEEEEVADPQTEEVADPQTEEEEVAEWKLRSSASNEVRFSRRDYQSEGGVRVTGGIAEGRGYKSLGTGLHPSETGSAGRRSGGDSADDWHSSPEVVASKSIHPQTEYIGSTPPFPQEDEMEGSIRTGNSPSNEEENAVPSLEMTGEPENKAPESSYLPTHPITARSPADHEEDWEDVEEEDSNQSEELSMKTPAFVREKRNALSVDPQNTPTVFKGLQPSVPVGAAAMRKPAAVRGKTSGTKKDLGLPKSYVTSVFKHFAKTKVSSDVYPVLKEIMERYFDRLADDLEVYAAHANRKTIEVEDVELLMRRQGFVTDSMPVNVLIEKYLPMESRKLLIPVATSGNYVIPKPRRK
uniref:CENP-T/Histone H4 histone fold domain-containing protein n=1 Tax=Esox lucius TaxID=8010 RepID=A0A6Q2Z9L3_ESOLU